MKAKKVVTVVLTLVVFLTAAFLGVSAVYRIEEVTLFVEHVSAPAIEEAAALKEALENAYLKCSTIAADDEAAKAAFEDFSYFRLTGFEKQYPGRLLITATEDAEVYAVQSGDVYEVYSASGTLLSTRQDGKNRADGKDNVFVFGVEGAGEFVNTPVFAALSTLDRLLEGVRSNVTEATLQSPTSNKKDDILWLTFREGVRAKIYAPSERAEEKAASLCALYSEGLSVSDRTQGTIYVPDSGEAYYSSK